MKEVMLSIQPQHIANICTQIGTDDNGKPIYKKRIEVRKTRPKIDTPFKCYIYCTKAKLPNGKHLYINEPEVRDFFDVTDYWTNQKDTLLINETTKYKYKAYLAECKVIGEFICDRIDKYKCNYGECLSYLYDDLDDDSLNETCLDRQQIADYGKYKTLYAWHISNLVIYDKPKELSEFRKCDRFLDCLKCKQFATSNNAQTCNDRITRPPQSWCYVEV